MWREKDRTILSLEHWWRHCCSLASPNIGNTFQHHLEGAARR
jgi:hypothetical protein